MLKIYMWVFFHPADFKALFQSVNPANCNFRVSLETILIPYVAQVNEGNLLI